MVKSYQIEKFENIVEIGTTLGKNWFRGHSKLFNKLTPGIFRSQYNTPMHELCKPQQESEIVYKFKTYAPSIIKNVPEEFDFLTWLFWIQHYGIPTRLLDWTQNIFVATFFSVVADHSEDGELWTIYPENLNDHSEIDGLAFTNNRQVKFLSGQPFHSNPTKLLEDLALEKEPMYPIALIPPKIFPRINSQHGAFTIHPKPSNNNLPIEQILKNEKDITRYVIPKRLKSDFEKKLSYLGFNYRTLFPDLEGLAKAIVREDRYFGWGQPNPPIFKNFEE